MFESMYESPCRDHNLGDDPGCEFCIEDAEFNPGLAHAGWDREVETVRKFKYELGLLDREVQL